MAVELNARGHACSENTVARLMRESGIRAKAPRQRARTTDSRHGLPVAGNVLGRDFAPAGPNAAWSADITYIPTADGWPYLAVVEDLFSRMIVGWAMDGAMTSRLPGLGWWPTPTGAASTPASSTGRSSAGAGSPAA
jgi:transposase InsO family protein